MKRSTVSIARRTSLAYWLVALLWIVVSDKVLGFFVKDIQTFERLQSYKGWAFVTLTAGLLFLALRSQLRLLDQREAERLAAERRYRALVESSADAIFIIRGSKIVYANPALVKLFGAASDRELLGRDPLDVFHPDCHDAIGERIRQTRATGSPVPLVEEKLVSLDGGIIEVEVAATPMMDGDEQSIHVSIRDIRERKHSERALKASEERLRLAMEAVRMGSWERDLKGGGLHWSTSLEKINGFEPGTFPGTLDALRELLHPEDRPVMEAARKLALEGDGEYQAELRFRRPDGGYRWGLVRGKIIFDSNGRPERIVGIELDITESKLAEQRVRESEARLKLALAASRMGVWEWEPATGRSYRSPECRELYGVRRFQGDMEEFKKLVHPEDRETLTAIMNKAIADRGDYAVEYRIIRPDGQERWLADQAQVRCDEAGEPTRVVGTVRDVTSRKMAEFAVRERLELERQLTLLASTAPGAIYSFRVLPDGSSYFPYASVKFQEMFGLKPEVLGRSSAPAFALVHSEDLPQVQASIQESARLLTPWNESFRINHPQRGLIWLEGSSTPLREVSGATLWHGFLIDVTIRHNAVEQLRQSEERLRMLMSGIQEHAIYLLTTDGRVASWNSGAARIKGYGEEEILGEHFSKFHLPEEIAAGNPQKALEQAAEHGSFNDEGWRVRKDGTRIWASVTLSAIYDENRFLRGFTSITHDLTERKQAESALSQERLRMAAIVNSAMDGIITVDGNQQVIVFNPAAERMFRCPAVDAVGRSLDQFIPARYRVKHHQHISDFSLTGVSTRAMGSFGAISGLRSDGEEFPIEASISQVVVDGHKLFTVTCRDITERVRAEALRKSLEGQLMQAQKMDAMGTLAGGIAHDFNNILAAILGNVELARWDLNSPGSVETSLDEIARAGNRAKNVVRQILTFSRQQPQDRAIIALAPVVEECVSLLRATIPAGVELEKVIRPGLPSVLADATQLHQVILNLCTNAWHALPENRGRIRLILETVSITAAEVKNLSGLVEGDYVRLSVADNGSGMDEATLGRIFEPFFTTKPPGEGSGLGLAVVHGIVKSHDGVVDVHSRPGKGTTFLLYLPAVVSDSALEQHRHDAFRRGNGERILYVDDEEQLVALATRLLARLGYEVEAFQRPDRALEAFLMTPERFAAVITDFNMPGISGLELAREMRRVRPGVRIILSSGYISDELVQRAGELGIEHVIHKPNTVEDLGKTLQAILSEPG